MRLTSMDQALLKLRRWLVGLFVTTMAAGCAVVGAEEGNDESIPYVGEPRVEAGLALDEPALAAHRTAPEARTTVSDRAPHQVVMADGTPLPLRRWGPSPETGEPPRAVVLGVHGLNDHAGSFAPTAAALVPEGMAVYAWDQRGFGASQARGSWPGTDTLVADASWVAGQLRERYPQTPIYLMGISMGGAVIALGLDQEPDLPVDGVVLSGPAVWGEEVMPWHQRWALWVGERLVPDLAVSARAVGIEPTDLDAVLDDLAEDPLWIRRTRVEVMAGVAELMDEALEAIPQLDRATMLIQYGGQDEVIPPEAMCAMYQRLPTDGPWRVAHYPEGYHMLTRSSIADRVLADVAAFIDAPAAPLPSGQGVDRAEAIGAVCEN
ncbi:alpha/beta fold hydrolase [Spiribacter sp. 2438]|uniref:alpha/beta hydrolase n=1 Tax=Spiribacter sp. 2438 TaxID=2666185 RepID=UPI0012AF7C60|nr:alpha/beta hydrolase [Spiribacter sp. 2438]QGM21846.1 alpha/beta fold hydrolase [Spiribacter sp. 2438]